MDFSELAKLASGHVEARAIQVAVSLGVFEALKDGSRDAATIASLLRTDPRATELLLHALVALGLAEKRDRFFSLTDVSAAYLLRSSPKYLGGMVLFESSLWSCWEALGRSVRSGKPARRPNMYQEDPEETERFIYAMDSLVKARGDAELVAEKVDLSGVAELLDVGSGPATYPIYLCNKYPGLRATIFDLPGTLKITEKIVRASELKDRIRLIAGDYRVDPIPGRYQMVFLSNVIHAESAQENAGLMAKLHSCLDSGGRIVIKDHILDDTLARPAAGVIFALTMLLTTNYGRCYSFNEVKGWLEGAGFERVREIPLPSPLTSSLVVGEKES